VEKAKSFFQRAFEAGYFQEEEEYENFLNNEINGQ
jgi:hypothetical protein